MNWRVRHETIRMGYVSSHIVGNYHWRWLALCVAHWHAFLFMDDCDAIMIEEKL